MPASSSISIPTITVSAFCALGAVGSRKALTPFETASTPVIAAHPLEKTFSSSQNVTAAVAGKMRNRFHRSGVSAGRERLHHPNPDHGEQATHKKPRRNHEHHSGLAHSPQVH